MEWIPRSQNDREDYLSRIYDADDWGLSPLSFHRIDLQYCAKEMQTKFAEISETTRISAIKFRTFVSDENAAKFRFFYCFNIGEISQAMCESKRNFAA